MPIDNWVTFVALGDSLTAGFMSPMGFSGSRYYPYTAVLEALMRGGLGAGCVLNLVLVNKGVSGDSTDGMLERFDSSVSPEEPDYVILWAGINDLYAGASLEHVAGNITELTERTRQIGAEPIICTVTPVEGSPHFNEQIRALNASIRELCEAVGYPYVDLYAATANQEQRLDPRFSDDGVHLSQEGYTVVAQAIYREAVKDILEKLAAQDS
jgi:lysophospholipase L1-like esterase